MNPAQYSAPITIEDNVWLGASVTVLPGVTIGAGSVVAAGSVVTKNVPPMSVVAGVPARLIRTITMRTARPRTAPRGISRRGPPRPGRDLPRSRRAPQAPAAGDDVPLRVGQRASPGGVKQPAKSLWNPASLTGSVDKSAMMNGR